jgi:hypothetical protein
MIIHRTENIMESVLCKELITILEHTFVLVRLEKPEFPVLKEKLMYTDWIGGKCSVSLLWLTKYSSITICGSCSDSFPAIEARDVAYNKCLLQLHHILSSRMRGNTGGAN